jgi:hypothetical protein
VLQRPVVSSREKRAMTRTPGTEMETHMSAGDRRTHLLPLHRNSAIQGGSSDRVATHGALGSSQVVASQMRWVLYFTHFSNEVEAQRGQGG